jgi:hypothetical protein
MTDSDDHHAGTEPDFLAHSRIAEELGAPRAFRVFGFFLVGVVFSAFLLMLVVTLALKGWPAWASVYLRPATWLFIALCAPISVPLANWHLKRNAVQSTPSEKSCMLVAARAVAASFFLIGILAIANT